MTKIFFLLIFVLISCGKQAPRHDLPVPDPTWAENRVSQINKSYADIFLVHDTQGKPEIIKVSFPYTIKNAYQSGRILSGDKKYSLSINNYTLLECFGPDRYGYTGCRMEIRGLTPGHYQFEY